MDVSYILSFDELFTLLSLIPDRSDAGQLFCSHMLPEAEICELDGLVEKKIARRHTNGQVELIPVINMFAEALARADKVEIRERGCLIRSPWITLFCEEYPYIEKHIKITPLKEGD